MQTEDIAQQAYEALTEARSIAPFSARGASLSDQEAYRAAARLRDLRAARIVGRKIGFTNRNIWPLYTIDRPIWGDVTEDSLLTGPSVSLAPYVEPRLEPEIVLGLGAAPVPEMDEADLAACIDWAAPGFEVVQSIYPGWKFAAGDTIAAGGLHGGLMIGARFSATDDVIAGLPDVAVTLSRNGEAVESGVGAHALGGPLSALRHLIDVLADDPHNPPLAAGEVITTGTLTDAWPLKAGEVWSARYAGVIDTALEIRLT